MWRWMLLLSRTSTKSWRRSESTTKPSPPKRSKTQRAGSRPRYVSFLLFNRNLQQLVFVHYFHFFFFQSEVLTKEVAATEMTLKTSTVEVKEVKSQLQALEIELQSQLSMVR